VHLSPIDTGGSGLAGTQYRLQGASSWSAAVGNVFVVPAPPGGAADGVHVYQYRALDNAGNSSSIGSCTVWVDTTPPTTTATGLQPDDLSGWRTTSQTVSLSADDGSGSGVTGISYSVDGAAPQTYSGPFTVSGTGQHAVTYAATDAAGNVEATNTGWVNIDTTAPTTTQSGLQIDDLSGWRTTSQTVSLSATDTGGSGVASISYTVDGGAAQTYSGPFTVSGFLQHQVTYWATDAAGNVEATHTGWVNISNPYTTVTNLAANNHSRWHKSATTVTMPAAATAARSRSTTRWTRAAGRASPVRRASSSPARGATRSRSTP
jgi:hypothetical protein